MGQTTAISWTDATFNCWWGCTRVEGSPACGPAEGEPGAQCYAEVWDARTGGHHWGADAPRRFFGDKHWNEPVLWNRKAEKEGIRKRVFCMSMGDWAEGRPDQTASLERLWQLILETPWLDWQMLTKRPQLITKLCPLRSQRIWHGVTAETQKWLDLRWRHLRDVDTEIRWLSIEPIFEAMVLPDDFLALGNRSWVVVGGQSGTGALAMHPEWARRLRDQCIEASVPFFFKQWGSLIPITTTDGRQELPFGDYIPASGFGFLKNKHHADGALIDGVAWQQFPIAGQPHAR